MTYTGPVLGVFEWLNPLFGLIDYMLFFLPAFAKLLLWGAGAGAFSMWLYGKVSPQGKLDALVAETKALQGQLMSSDGNKDLWLGFARASFARVGITLGPAVLSSLPVLFLLGFLHTSYGVTPPEAGEPVALLLDQPDAIMIDEGQKFAAGWTVAWPQPGEDVEVHGPDGEALFVLTPETRPGTVSRPGVMTALFGASGRLAPTSPVSHFTIETIPQALIQPKVSFPYQWMIPFFLAVIVSSLALKSLLKLS